MNEIVYTYRGGVERGTGEPGYRWRDGYSESTADGHATFPWMTKRECQNDARTRGAVARFFVPSDRVVAKEDDGN
jgi:hypothetical protein